MKRFIKCLIHFSRLPEVLCCIRTSKAPFREILAFLKLLDLKYPYTVMTVDGHHFIVNDWYDLTTVWVVLYGSEYTVLPNDKRIVDLGANVGVFACYAARKASSAIVCAVEPFPENFRRLKETVELNGLAHRIISIEAAAVGLPSVVSMDASPDIPSHSRKITDSGDNHISVRGMGLSGILDEIGWNSADLLKVDIEGGEYELIANTEPDVLKRFDRIGLEYHKGGDQSSLFKRLEDVGFARFRYPKKGMSGVVEWRRKVC